MAPSRALVEFLVDCVSKEAAASKSSAFTYDLKHGGEVTRVAAVVLPPSSLSPLSDFTGPLECSTVLFASLEPPEEVEEESPELKPVLDNFSDSLLKEEHAEPDGKPEEMGPSLHYLVQFFPQEEVRVVSLSSSRVFFNKPAALFHSAQNSGSTTVLHADLSRLSPLPIDVARMLCSLYSIVKKPVSASLPALWILCADNAAKNTVALGCSYAQGGSLLQVYNITLNEVAEKGLKQVKKMSEVKKKHVGHGKTVLAEYDIASSTNSASGQMISMQFAWEDPEDFLCPPPLAAAEAVLHIAIKPGSLQSLYTMYSEIEKLLWICEASSKGVDLSQDTEEVLDKSDSLAGKVEEFLKEVDAPLSNSQQINVVSPTIEGTIYNIRENVDFTEHLWLFSKDAKGATDLQEALSSIFKSLLLGKVKNIALHESSTSSLADLLRQLNSCHSLADREALTPKFQLILSHENIIQFLGQIGCEKMKRDISGFLISSNVATGTQCDAFFQDAGHSSSSSGDVLEDCHVLCNLFYAVELVATLMSFSLPNSILSGLVRAAIDTYKNKKFEHFQTTPRFSIPIFGTASMMVCANILPSTWKLSSNSNSSICVVKDTPLLASRARVEHEGSENKHYYVYECVSSQITKL